MKREVSARLLCFTTLQQSPSIDGTWGRLDNDHAHTHDRSAGRISSACKCRLYTAYRCTKRFSRIFSQFCISFWACSIPYQIQDNPCRLYRSIFHSPCDYIRSRHNHTCRICNPTWGNTSSGNSLRYSSFL